MLGTLATILRDNWEWRRQIGRLAIFELVKKSRGAVLSWAWFLIKPGMYIFCFWFALDVGLRVGSGGEAGAPPYLLWLCAGLIPWFFMQDMLGAGIDVDAPLPVSGEQDQVSFKRHLHHLRVGDHAGPAHADGGSARPVLRLRHAARSLPCAGAAFAGAHVFVLGSGVHPVQPAFGHQQGRGQPHARHVHALLLALRRHLQREERAGGLDPGHPVLQPHHVFRDLVSGGRSTTRRGFGRTRLCAGGSPPCSR